MPEAGFAQRFFIYKPHGQNQLVEFFVFVIENMKISIDHGPKYFMLNRVFYAEKHMVGDVDHVFANLDIAGHLYTNQSAGKSGWIFDFGRQYTLFLGPFDELFHFLRKTGQIINFFIEFVN